MCLLGATHNVWYSMASAAVHVVGAVAVGLVVMKAELCAEWCAVWCSISVAVVGVMSGTGVLCGAAAVQLWLTQQCVCAATIGKTVCVTCASNDASNRAWPSVGALNCPGAWHTIRCMRNTTRRC